MRKRRQLEELFLKYQLKDFRWIDPKSIVVSQWVRMKCMFGCIEYGKIACCPPNTPPVDECRSFFGEYSEGVVFHFEKKVEEPEERHEWARGVNERLLGLEREVFLAGNPKTFLLFMDSCSLCKNCGGGEKKKGSDVRTNGPRVHLPKQWPLTFFQRSDSSATLSRFCVTIRKL